MAEEQKTVINLGWLHIVGKLTVVGQFARRNPESRRRAEDKFMNLY
jgi:hypothetical protein